MPHSSTPIASPCGGTKHRDRGDTLGNSSTEEHALVLEGSRKLRGRYRTVVHRIARENKTLEKWRHKKPPTFEEFLRHHELDDTYSRRFDKLVRQFWVDRYMQRVLALDDPKAFREALGAWLSRFIEGKDVYVAEGISHSDVRPHQPTLWFGTQRTSRR
ncbi:MAG: hypothetical protein JWM52_881 [Candidatus Saccharibacteria bacterium]|nr:hypothetical protein [Candidatus Saccharibacteria bacterium]